jgi:hypothetical protein
MVTAHAYPSDELESALRKVARHEPLTHDERALVLQAVDDAPSAEGGCVLTEEEADELERACVEADEDRKAGRAFTLEQVLADLRGA